jgi:predicted TPR repeat methyltransferase
LDQNSGTSEFIFKAGKFVSTDNKNRNPILQRAFDIKDQEECKDVYKDWANSYDSTMVGELKYSAPDSIAKSLQEFLPSRTASILDLGCGTGLVGSSLSALDYVNIDGVDFSEEMLAVADKLNVYGDLKLADLTKPTGIPSANYDAAVCAGLFTYGHLDSTCLEEIFRVIKKGGLFAAAIREQIYEEMGFLEKFTQWENSGQIKTLCKQSKDNYENANKNDGIYLVLQKL